MRAGLRSSAKTAGRTVATNFVGRIEDIMRRGTNCPAPASQPEDAARDGMPQAPRCRTPRPGSQVFRFPRLERPKTGVGHSRPAQGAREFQDRLVLTVVAQLKRPEMNGPALFGVENVVSLDRVVGRHVVGSHEPPWQVGSDGQEGQTRGAKAPANVFEVGTEPGVAREIDHAGRCFQRVAAPEGAVAVELAATRPVLSGHTGDSDPGAQVQALPPVQIPCLQNLVGGEETPISKAGEESGSVVTGQSSQSRDVEVVVMVVTD